ncbi:alpha/beta fold hydrolase [Streptomyces sp. A1499]|nr:alpha/beta fold hydrolase [Streptomyces sp. A1499]
MRPRRHPWRAPDATAPFPFAPAGPGRVGALIRKVVMNRPSLFRRTRGRLSLLATAGVSAALLATSVAPASAGKGSSSPGHKPTVVLVHGAFADSSSWNGVVKQLRRQGCPVVAAANPLRGLGSDAAYLKEILADIDGPVVLAGHSYGGAVISDAAQGAANVKALVYRFRPHCPAVPRALTCTSNGPSSAASSRPTCPRTPPTSWRSRSVRSPVPLWRRARPSRLGRLSRRGCSWPPRTATSQRRPRPSWPNVLTRTPPKSRRRMP